MDNEKMVSFSKDDFTEDSWDILCSEFEVDPDKEYFNGLIMVEEDDEEFDEDEE